MKTELAKIHHARSSKEYPDVDLMENEYVVLSINRSKSGLMMIWAGEAVGFIALTVVLVMLASGGFGAGLAQVNGTAMSYLYMLIFALYGVLLISGLVGTSLYKSNHLIITNERAIHKVRTNLLARSTNIISLQSIEDVSFKQSGLVDYILRLGTIRMSTVESTYTFSYVDTPRDEIKTITRLVHEAKEKN